MSKKNRKKSEEIRKHQIAIDRNKFSNYCRCNHRDSSGQYTLIATNKKDENGRTIWKCRDCEHDVKIQRFSNNEIQKAVDVLTTVCDAIKMSARPDDERTLERAQKVQATLPTLVRDYNSVLKHADDTREKERRRRGQRTDNGMYSGPIQSFR